MHNIICTKHLQLMTFHACRFVELVISFPIKNMRVIHPEKVECYHFMLYVIETKRCIDPMHGYVSLLTLLCSHKLCRFILNLKTIQEK